MAIAPAPIGPCGGAVAAQRRWRSGKGWAMATGKAKTPNLLLRYIRETERRESREEFADAVVKAGRQLGDHHLACDARLVARWEDGDVGRPRPAYQRALTALTGRPFDELGFRRAMPSQCDRPASQDRADCRFTSMGGARRATIGFGQPGPASVPDNDLAIRLATAQAVSAAEVTIMRHQVDHIRALDRQLGAPVVLEQMQALMATLTGLLIYSLRPGIREQLAAVLADAGALAGWQALDMGLLSQAWRHYETAKLAAREARSDTLLAHAMGEQSFALLDVGERQLAVELIGEARALTMRTGPPLLAAWLHAAEAEAHASAVNDASCRRSLDAASAALPTDTTDPALPFIFLSETHLARWRGNCLVRLGDTAAVEHSLGALAAMDATFTRAEAGLRCDLAEAMLLAGERDESALHARRARELALRVGSVRQRRRIDRLAVIAFPPERDSEPAYGRTASCGWPPPARLASKCSKPTSEPEPRTSSLEQYVLVEQA